MGKMAPALAGRVAPWWLSRLNKPLYKILLLQNALLKRAFLLVVFNLVPGMGPEVGAAMSAHPDIDLISFTGSTRAGSHIAKKCSR